MKQYEITVSYVDDVFNIEAKTEDEAIAEVNRLIDELRDFPEVSLLDVVEVK